MQALGKFDWSSIDLKKLGIVLLILLGLMVSLYLFARLVSAVTTEIVPVIVTLFRYVLVAITPFVIALILAELLDPVVGFFQTKLRIPRPLAVLVTLGAVIIIFGWLLVMMFSKLMAELWELVNLLPQYRVEISNFINDLLIQYEEFSSNLPGPVSAKIQETVESFGRTLEGTAAQLVNSILNALSGLPYSLFLLVVVCLGTYIISRDKDHIINAISEFTPRKWRKPINLLRDRITIDIIGLIKSQLLFVTISVVIAAVGYLVIGNRYWLLLALVTGILDIIPVVGPGTIMLPWALFSFLMGHPKVTVILLLVYVTILIVRQVLQPYVMGDSIGVHPLTMLFSIYVGIVLVGAWGIFVGPILVIIIKAILKTCVALRSGEL